MSKKKATGWILGFVILLYLPLLIYPLIKKHIEMESTENRTLAEMPVVGGVLWDEWKASLEAFPGAFNSYFNDHLPYRTQLIYLNSLAEWKLLKDSPSTSVVLGKDNWLYFTNEGCIEDYKGTNLYTQEQLDQILDNMQTTEAYLDRRGIEFVLMIPSNKESIYTEHLPDYIYERNELKRADQVIAYLKDHMDIRIVYPKEVLLSYKDQYDVYWHYDTHWNSLGAYIGAKALLEELGIPQTQVENLSITQTNYSNYDLAGMMNLTSYYVKNMPWDVSYDLWGYNYHDLNILEAEDQKALIYNSTSPDRRRFFMVRDSFAGGMAGFLANNFAYSYMPHWISFQQEMVDEQNPDIFVYELVERRLDALLNFRLED